MVIGQDGKTIISTTAKQSKNSLNEPIIVVNYPKWKQVTLLSFCLASFVFGGILEGLGGILMAAMFCLPWLLLSIPSYLRDYIILINGKHGVIVSSFSDNPIPWPAILKVDISRGSRRYKGIEMLIRAKSRKEMYESKVFINTHFVNYSDSEIVRIIKDLKAKYDYPII